MTMQLSEWYSIFYDAINYCGLRYFGTLWPIQQLPGSDIAHFSFPPFVMTSLDAHLKTGKAPDYFSRYRMAEFSKMHGGRCTFFNSGKINHFQTSNCPYAPDKYLVPGTALLKRSFGNFIGTKHSTDEDRKSRRKIITALLCNQPIADEKYEQIHHLATDFVAYFSHRDEVDFDELCFRLVMYVNSHVEGIYDLTEKPLSDYWDDPKHSYHVKNFFITAANSYANQEAMDELDKDIDHFTKDVLLSNLPSINAAADTNFFKKYLAYILKINGPVKLTQEMIENLNLDDIKDLNALLINSFYTTVLALKWIIGRIESEEEIKQQILEELQDSDMLQTPRLSTVAMAVVESLRLDSHALGGNRTVQTAHGNMCVGSQYHQDRSEANRDPNAVSDPEHFNLKNIQELGERKGFTSAAEFFGHNCIEFNSFMLLSTRGHIKTSVNPTQCPARTWAVNLLINIVEALYGSFGVSLQHKQEDEKLSDGAIHLPQQATIAITPREIPANAAPSLHS